MQLRKVVAACATAACVTAATADAKTVRMFAVGHKQRLADAVSYQTYRDKMFALFDATYPGRASGSRRAYPRERYRVRRALRGWHRPPA